MKLNKRGYFDTGYIKFLRIEEFKQIETYINNLQSPAMKTCINVMLYTGLRVSDATKLKRSDFDKDFKIANILQQKTGKSLDISIPEILRSKLITYYDLYKDNMINDFLFFSSWRNQSLNDHLKRSSIELVFVKMRRKIGLDHSYYTNRKGIKLYRISPHTLRHFVAWRYYEAGGKDLKIASEMIGHSKIETTARYINALESNNNREKIIELAFNF